jgi:zinc transport system substrate-binding protein
MRTRIILIIIPVIVAVAAATTAAGASTRSGTVVAAFYPVAYAVEQIAPAGTRVKDLTPAGAEPHDIELKPSDIETIDKASLVLYLGEGFQPAVEKAVRAAHVPAVDLLANQKLATGRIEGKIGLDPHVWLDPIRYAQMAATIGRALHRPKQATAFIARLRALDRSYRAGLLSCQRKIIVTSHAAFGYLSKRYGLTQLALEGLSPEAEPSPKALARLVEQVRKTHATTVFFETLVSPKLAQTVAREAHVKTAVLDPIEGITPNALKHGANYFTVMRSNLAALRLALSCS